MALTGRPVRTPAAVAAIQQDSERLGFSMASEPATCALLRLLAASKPNGRFLELGTGTGLSAAWLLDGMDAGSRLITVDSDEAAMEIAQRHLACDGRIQFLLGDGSTFLEDSFDSFDFIFADTWPGKFHHLDEALQLVKPGGIYFVDDLLPQPNWPDDHPPKVERLIEDLLHREGFVPITMDWSSGLLAMVRKT